MPPLFICPSFGWRQVPLPKAAPTFFRRPDGQRRQGSFRGVPRGRFRLTAQDMDEPVTCVALVLRAPHAAVQAVQRFVPAIAGPTGEACYRCLSSLRSQSNGGVAFCQTCFAVSFLTGSIAATPNRVLSPHFRARRCKALTAGFRERPVGFRGICSHTT